MQPMVTVAWSI